MDFRIIQSKKEIEFSVYKDDEELLDKLSFVHLVQMAFGGNIVKCESFHFNGNEPFIAITLSMPNYNSLSNAEYHSKQNIENNSIKKIYRSALTKADPVTVLQKKLKKWP